MTHRFLGKGDRRSLTAASGPGTLLEAVWAEVVGRNPNRDVSKDEDRRQTLRQRIFATVFSGVSDADTVRDKVLASMPEFCYSPRAL